MAQNLIKQFDRIYKTYPWLDFATDALPQNLDQVNRWARLLWMRHGSYRQSMKMLSSYFVTGLEIDDQLDDKDRQKLKDFLEDDVDYANLLGQVGANLMAYGKVYATAYLPIRRSLRCSGCGMEIPVEQAEFKWRDFRFTRARPCKACGNTGDWERVDRRDRALDRVRVSIWSPEQFHKPHNQITKRNDFFFKIPGSLKTQVKEGVSTVLFDLPWEYIECVQKNADLHMADGLVFFATLDDIAGLTENGEGLPPAIANFPLMWLIQVLNRQDQAIAQDYMTGMRLYSPAPQARGGAGAGGGVMNDPVLNRGSGNFVSGMRSLIEQHRADPSKAYAVPSPVNYQFTGGEGASLSPYQIVQSRTEELLHACGVPMEFYRANLQGQGAPMMLRMIESMHSYIPSAYRRCLSWLVNLLHKFMNLPAAKIGLKPSHIADDLEQRQVLLSLMSGNQISPQTALEPFGIEDVRSEVRRIFDQQVVMAEEQKRFDDQMLKKQDAGLVQQGAGLPTPGMAAQPPPPPGDPAAMGGAPPAAGGMGGGGIPTPDPNSSLPDMEMMAEQAANALLAMPYELRRGEMKKIKDVNQTYHSLVKSKMEEVRQQAQTIGGYQQVQAQVAGSGGKVM